MLAQGGVFMDLDERTGMLNFQSAPKRRSGLPRKPPNRAWILKPTCSRSGRSTFDRFMANLKR